MTSVLKNLDRDGAGQIIKVGDRVCWNNGPAGDRFIGEIHSMTDCFAKVKVLYATWHVYQGDYKKKFKSSIFKLHHQDFPMPTVADLAKAFMDIEKECKSDYNAMISVLGYCASDVVESYLLGKYKVEDMVRLENVRVRALENAGF